MPNEIIPELLSIWGKAKPRPDVPGPSWHPLIYHLLDVAAAGERLLELHAASLSHVAHSLGIETDVLRRATLFILALHDIGKVSPRFQAKVEALWPEAFGVYEQRPDPGHGGTGMAFLLCKKRACLRGLMPDWRENLRAVLLAPFMGHHGRPIDLPNLALDDLFGTAAESAASAIVGVMWELFQPSPLPRIKEKHLKPITWWLAGFCTLADWLGSSQRWFPYTAPDLAPKDYLDRHARPAARRAVHEAGLQPSLPSPFVDLATTSGQPLAPSPVQAWAASVPLPPRGPLLAVIEDMTGSGKTEAALVLAHRLMGAGRAQGLYFALPTMATANALFARLQTSYRRLFASDALPSLALAHGRATLHEGFRASVVALADASSAKGREQIGEQNDFGDAAGSACAAWIGDERRKALLAEIGVGTIDQALLAALPVSFQSLRLFGLAHKILIVDEAHAYDAYVERELKQLLQFQAVLGGHTIILSATLPNRTRNKLIEAYIEALGCDALSTLSQGYPRALVLGGRDVAEADLPTRSNLARSVDVERLPDVEAAISAVRRAAAKGAAIAWIRNTVDDVQEAAGRLRAEGIEPILFHARMAQGDRQVIEDAVVARFGKAGPIENRPGVLLATQVVEQSLDLDFDLIISDLAPVDLLLQRAGRLWRHLERLPPAMRPVPGPRLLVLSPEPVDNPTASWFTDFFPRAGKVYDDPLLLWLTARRLFDSKQIVVPEDVRTLIEAVYSETPEAPAAVIQAFARLSDHSRSGRMAATVLANATLLNPSQGYGGRIDKWEQDQHVTTRLGEAVTTLRLCTFDGSVLLPWCRGETSQLAWAMSEITIRRARLAGGTVGEGILAQAMAVARAAWPRYEETMPILVLDEHHGMAASIGSDGEGRAVSISYSRLEGLRFADTPGTFGPSSGMNH